MEGESNFQNTLKGVQEQKKFIESNFKHLYLIFSAVKDGDKIDIEPVVKYLNQLSKRP